MHRNTFHSVSICLIGCVLMLFTGCSRKVMHHANISEDIVSPIQQASFCTNVFAAVSDEAMYYQIEGGKLFALDKKGNNIQIGTMNFVDDKETGSSRDGIPAPKRYSDNAELEKDDPQVHAGIMNASNDTEVFGLDNVIIDYYDDKNIYTTTLENKVKYRIYDWNGKLVNEIIPSETLGVSDGAIPIAYHEMDYSSIVRVWNGQLIGYHFRDSEIEFFSCDLETGACKFLET